jgi:hypothetical protein
MSEYVRFDPQSAGLHQFTLLDFASYRRQFKLENRASICAGGHPNPTVMVFSMIDWQIERPIPIPRWS